jgi:hypothetical protein
MSLPIFTALLASVCAIESFDQPVISFHPEWVEFATANPFNGCPHFLFRASAFLFKATQDIHGRNYDCDEKAPFGLNLF